MEKGNERPSQHGLLDSQRSSECELLGSSKPGDSSDCVSPRDEAGNTPKEYFCGIGELRPKWLQVFASAKFFTFFLCVNCLIEGALVSGFTSVILSTIEKRYRFSSTAASFIISTFDLSVLISVVFISYFGNKGHKPRWLGLSVIVQGIGAFVFALPEFIFGPYEVGANASFQLESCQEATRYIPSCDHANSIAYFLFILAQVLIGIGAAALFTIGTSYLDDIVHPQYVSIHLGIFYACAVVGPAVGYGLGGAFLSIYVDPWKTTDLEPTDPGWVGAWWICFIFSGTLSLLISIPFLMFPRLLSDCDIVMEARRKEMAKTYVSRYGEEEKFSVVLKTFPTHLKKLFGVPSWVLVTLAVSALFFSLDGMVAFAPKYIESQFEIPASTASLIAGGVAIPSGGAGVLTGAVIMYCLKSRGKETGKKGALVNWTVALLAMIPALTLLTRCQNLNIAGINTEYATGATASGEVLDSPCNQLCNCSSSIFEPVCGTDGLTYFSPCRAGCDKAFIDGDTSQPIFENCSCVIGQSNTTLVIPINQSGTNVDFSTADEGWCDSGCNKLGLFAVGIAALVYLIFVLKIPTILVTIRCVADEQRALALGVQSVLFRAFGSIPGPILFGVVFDSVCVYWQYECGRRGNCWVYDNRNLSLRALAIALVGLAVNVVLSFLAWVLYPTNGSKEEGSSSSSGGENHSLDRESEKPPNKVLLGNSEVLQTGIQISSPMDKGGLQFNGTHHGTLL